MVTHEDFEKIYRSDTFSVNYLADSLLTIPCFYKWSGSGHEGQHHFGDGGLAIHTLEVLKIMFSVNETMNYGLNKDVMYLAGLYHDYGKVFDYTTDEHGKWIPAPHKRNIHHISRSAMFFYHKATEMVFSNELTDEVLHCILSHHTRREYGSPVAPNSREAWLLTLADNMSARLNDCGTWDYIVKPK